MAGARPGQITVCPPSVRPAHPRDPGCPPFALLFLLPLAGPRLACCCSPSGRPGRLDRCSQSASASSWPSFCSCLTASSSTGSAASLVALLRWAKERDQDAAVPSRPEQRAPRESENIQWVALNTGPGNRV